MDDVLRVAQKAWKTAMKALLLAENLISSVGLGQKGSVILVNGTATVTGVKIGPNTWPGLTPTALNGSTAVGRLEWTPLTATSFRIDAINPASGAVQANDVSTVVWVLLG